MKKALIHIIIYLFTSFVPVCHASGGITHMFLAQETIALIPDQRLRNLLQNNLDAYLVGAYYPDSGYVAGNHYGEDSHWDPFIYAFADYIKEAYPDPVDSNPKLTAFLFGCATHRVSDEIAHWTFYQALAKYDFGRDWDGDPTIHEYGDLGIDLLINIDQSQWLMQPITWWVPVKDLVQVYHRMGKDEYTAEEIIRGTKITYYAGYGERLISAFVYPYLRWKLPWTSQHYYDWPEGGIEMDEKNVVSYLMGLWSKLHNSSSSLNGVSLSTTKPQLIHNQTATIAFAKEAIDKGYVEVAVASNQDGSIEIQPPIIVSYLYYQQLLMDLYHKLIGEEFTGKENTGKTSHLEV